MTEESTPTSHDLSMNSSSPLFNNNPLPVQVAQCFSELAKDLKEAFPEVPASSFDRRAGVMAKTTNDWIGMLAEYYEEFITAETNESLDEVIKHKQMEEKNAEISNKIVEYASEAVSRLARLGKTIHHIEKTIQCKNIIKQQMESLEALEKKIDEIRDVDHERIGKLTTEVVDLLERLE